MKHDSKRWAGDNSKWLSFALRCCAKITCPTLLKGERLPYSPGFEAQSIVEGESDSKHLKELNTTICIWKRAVSASLCTRAQPLFSKIPPLTKNGTPTEGRALPFINLIKRIPHRFIQRPISQVLQDFFIVK